MEWRQGDTSHYIICSYLPLSLIHVRRIPLCLLTVSLVKTACLTCHKLWLFWNIQSTKRLNHWKCTNLRNQGFKYSKTTPSFWNIQTYLARLKRNFMPWKDQLVNDTRVCWLISKCVFPTKLLCKLVKISTTHYQTHTKWNISLWNLQLTITNCSLVITICGSWPENYCTCVCCREYGSQTSVSRKSSLFTLTNIFPLLPCMNDLQNSLI